MVVSSSYILSPCWGFYPGAPWAAARCLGWEAQPFSAPATGLHRVSSRMRAHSGLSLQADEETSSFKVKNILLLASPFWLVSTPQAPSTLSILPREVRS